MHGPHILFWRKENMRSDLMEIFPAAHALSHALICTSPSGAPMHAVHGPYIFILEKRKEIIKDGLFFDLRKIRGCFRKK